MSITRQGATLLLAGLIAIALRVEARQSLPPVSCTIAPDTTVPITTGPGRQVYCGIDLGSRTAKLSVVSMVPGQGTTVRDERGCRRALGMGAQVFDAATKTAKPLPSASIDNLSDTIKAFQAICRTDRGAVVSAGATQWARDATNVAEVKTRVKAATGLDFDVLSHADEARFGYIAGALNSPGRIVLDPGSNSFQIAWQPKSGGPIQSALVEYGYVRGATNEFEPAADYTAAAAAYRAKIRAQINDALARRTPPSNLAALAGLVRSGALDADLVTLGQDGAVHWFVLDLLRDRGAWVADAKTFDARLAKPTPAKPMSRADVQAYLKGIGPADFQTLKSDPVKGLYGQRALVTPVLIEFLMAELGLRRLIVVPQETTTGQILAKIAK